jgi:hypothetical protein
MMKIMMIDDGYIVFDECAEKYYCNVCEYEMIES